MEREKPVILKPATGPKENSASSFFKCQETQKNWVIHLFNYTI